MSVEFLDLIDVLHKSGNAPILEQLQGQVFSRRLAEEVRDDEESAAGNDLLLNAGRALHQLAYEAHQLRTESERDR